MGKDKERVEFKRLSSRGLLKRFEEFREHLLKKHEEVSDLRASIRDTAQEAKCS